MDHFVVTAVLRNFSSSNNNSKWEISQALSALYLLRLCIPSFYANGFLTGNKGYVSIIFHEIVKWPRFKFFEDVEIRYHVSVIDIVGNKRFTQSVVYVLDNINPNDLENSPGFQCVLERYLKRETLLNDPAELLPGDCLTICVDVDFINLFSKPKPSLDVGIFTYEVCNDLVGGVEDVPCISLDTVFWGEDFSCDFDDYVTEGSSRKVFFRGRCYEFRDFGLMFRILTECEKFVVRSITDICDLYRLADMYGIQSVIEVCRQLIKSFLCATDDPRVREHVDQSVSKILQMARRYKDDDLKVTVDTYMTLKISRDSPRWLYRVPYWNQEANFPRVEMYSGISTPWKCEFKGMGYLSGFRMSKIVKPEFEFEFYQ